MQCPACKGPMWDNRTDKKNPKAPDWKCKDKDCIDDKGYVTAVWEEKEKPARTHKPKPEGRSFTPPQFRDDLPAELRDQEEYEQEFVQTVQNGGTPKVPMRQAYKSLTEWTLKEISPLYEAAGIGLSPEAAAAITATLFINADKRGKID